MPITSTRLLVPWIEHAPRDYRNHCYNPGMEDRERDTGVYVRSLTHDRDTANRFVSIFNLLITIFNRTSLLTGGSAIRSINPRRFSAVYLASFN